MLHIAGDSATILVLKLMQEFALDSIWRARRLRIEHANGITESNVESTHRLGVIVYSLGPELGRSACGIVRA